MKVAYGTEISAVQDVQDGEGTGLIYRYLPLNTYVRDGSGNLEREALQDENGQPILDSNNQQVYGDYTLKTTLNNSVYRYSNALQSYQYVYASGNENKATNAGRDMRLYSYYVYSYLTYDNDTGVPMIEYDIIMSDNYSDASTYWSNTPTVTSDN